MTSPEVLSGLRERIEAATGPDAELDIDLCIALSYIGYTDAPINLRRAASDDGWLDYETVDDGHRIDCSDQAPELTGSIDAALGLVERLLPGTARAVGDMAFADPTPAMKPWATIWTPQGQPKWNGEGATPALAILLALLTALQENTK